MLASGSSLYSEEYYEEILKLLEDPSVLQILWIYAIAMTVISLIVCFFVAKSSKLSKKYTFFGLLGMVGIFIVICRAMAKSVDLSPHFMWLGLIGIYGIIIMAIIMSVISFRKYNNVENNSGQSGQYYRSNDSKEDISDWEKRYEEGRKSREDYPQGYSLNGE